jgi:hypothetical protein
MPQRSRWFYAAVTLLVLSVVGIWNGYDEWAAVQTAGQRIATLTEIGYGILGPICAIAISWAWRSAKVLLVLWSLCLALTSGLAAMVWGGAPLWAGLVGGLGGALVGVFVIWMSRQEKRPAPQRQ